MTAEADAVVARYYVESYFDLAHAAAVLAGEQSTGTFVRVRGETDALRARHGATVVEVEDLEPRAAPSLPGAAKPPDAARVNAGHVAIRFPLENFGPSLPNLLAAVAGNLFELRELAGIRLLDLDLPGAFAARYPGPRFGIAGTRMLADATTGPLVGSIIKPSVGLSPDEHARLVGELAEAGADFCKDDELLANPPYSPLRERVRTVMAAVERAERTTGRRLMYAFNITDDIENLERNYEIVRDAGGTCVMACINLIGLTGISYLRSFCELPIHGHRAMIGALMRHPSQGIAFRAYQKLARLAGVDHLHTSGMNNKFYETNEEVAASVRDVLTPMLGGYSCLPVLSSSQWAGTAEPTYALTHTTDVLMVCGGGIHAHPGGVAAGIESVRQGWEAAVAGIPLRSYADGRTALREAIETFA